MATDVKERFRHREITFSCEAKGNCYSRNEVYYVLNGQSKTNYGKTHEISVK
ncbi:DNA-binding protein [Escherichia coli]